MSLGRLAYLQNAIAIRHPTGLHLTPPPTMHISVFSLVPVRWPDQGKTALWAKLKASALEEIASIRLPESFSCDFQEVRVKETAIILSTPEQPAPIRRLRDRLNELIVGAGLATQTFDRTHVTLARPAEDQRLDASDVADLEQMVAKVDVRVTAVKLVRELVYPSLEIEVLA